MTYWRLHYHLIWSTQDRQPTLTLAREKVFYDVIYKKSEELGLIIHAAGNVSDHVHVVLSIPPKIAVADCVRHLKGASSNAMNQIPDSHGQFKWQAGYAALSIGDEALDSVIAYVKRQKEHHRELSVIGMYEMTDKDD